MKNPVVSVVVPAFNCFFGYTILAGYNFGIRKDIFERSGGFDTRLNAMEDVELGKKVEKFGSIAFLDNLVVSVSARRWYQGIIQGSFDYIKPFLTYELFDGVLLSLTIRGKDLDR